MPHLDEGMLHAYLDNAPTADADLHLRECPECRANLEKARLLKEDADAILNGAAPVDIVMPSFEELQTKAVSRGSGSQQKDIEKTVGSISSFSQLRSIAWAATVVLAVAVGWYARSTILENGQSRVATEGETTGRLTIPLPEVADTAADAPDEPARSSVREEEESPEAELDEAPAPPPAEARRLPAVPLVDPSTAGAAGANTETSVAQQEPRERPRISPQVADVRAASEPTVALVAGARRESNEVVWTGVNEATAENILDGPVPTIEGLPVIAYATSNLDGTQIVRVSQLLDSGERVELEVTQDSGAGFYAYGKKGMERIETEAGVGTINTVTVAEGGLLIRLSAALTTDSLTVLGQKVSIER